MKIIVSRSVPEPGQDNAIREKVADDELSSFK